MQFNHTCDIVLEMFTEKQYTRGYQDAINAHVGQKPTRACVVFVFLTCQPQIKLILSYHIMDNNWLQ
jgi:hypothetical protein